MDQATEAAFRTAFREFLGVGEARLGVVGAGDSVQDTFDEGFDRVIVGVDYDPSVESFPLDFDLTDRSLSLRGAGMNTTRFPGAIRVTGDGSDQYTRPATLSGFSVDAGSPGIELTQAPYTRLADILLDTPDGSGFRIAPADSGQHTYGCQLWNVQAWNCGGAGFELERAAGPHGTTFVGCQAAANRGFGYQVRGANVTFHASGAQLNYNNGFEIRGTTQTVIGDSCYVEGNSRNNDTPVEIYGKNIRGLTVQNNYFHGINPRGANHDHKWVQRALNIHDSEVIRFRDCTNRRYGDAAAAFFNCENVTMAPDTHILDECTLT